MAWAARAGLATGLRGGPDRAVGCPSRARAKRAVAAPVALCTTLVARWYGFGARNSPTHTLWQSALVIVTFALISVPLGFALRQIALESWLAQQVRTTLGSYFGGSLLRVDTLRVRQDGQGGVNIDAVALVHQWWPHAKPDLQRWQVKRALATGYASTPREVSGFAHLQLARRRVASVAAWLDQAGCTVATRCVSRLTLDDRWITHANGVTKSGLCRRRYPDKTSRKSDGAIICESHGRYGDRPSCGQNRRCWIHGVTRRYRTFRNCPPLKSTRFGGRHGCSCNRGSHCRRGRSRPERHGRPC